MADAKTINIDGQQALKTMGELKSLAADLAKQLENCAVGSKEFSDTSKQLGEVLKQLKNASTAAQKAGANLNDAAQMMDTGFSSVTGSLSTLQGAVEGLGVNIKGVTGTVDGLGKSLIKLFANPYVAIIGAIVIAIKAVVDAIKSSEDRVNELKGAFSAFNPIIDFCKQALDAMAKVISNVVVAAVDGLISAIKTMAGWLDAIGKAFGADWDLAGNFEKAVNAAQALTAAEQDYIKKKRDWVVESAKIDNEVASLRNKVAQKDKYTNKERLAFLDQAIALETKKAKKEKELAEQNLKNLEAEAARSENDAAMNDKLAQAKAAVYQADTNLQMKTKELNAQRSEAINKINAEAAAVKKAAQDKIDAANKEAQAIADAEAKEAQAIADKEAADAAKLAAEQLAKIDAVIKGINDKKLADEEASKTELQRLEEDYRAKLALLEGYEAEAVLLTLQYEAQKTAIEEKEATAREQKQKTEMQTSLQVGLQMANNFASILSSVSDIIGEDSKEAFEASKAFQISSAVILTITGAIGAYTGAVGNAGITSIPLVGPGLAMALGITNAAVVAASGAAQIAQISKRLWNDKSTTTSASTPNTSSTAVNSTLVAPTQFSQEVTNAKLEENVGDTKVYVTESDIQRTTKKVSVAESESRY